MRTRIILEQAVDESNNPILYEGNPVLLSHLDTPDSPKQQTIHHSFYASNTPVDGHWLVEVRSGYGNSLGCCRPQSEDPGIVIGATSHQERIPQKIHTSALDFLKKQYPKEKIKDKYQSSQSQPK